MDDDLSNDIGNFIIFYINNPLKAVVLIIVSILITWFLIEVFTTIKRFSQNKKIG